MTGNNRVLEAIDADVKTIIASKMDFMADGGRFLYYRKGEALGAPEVAAYAARILQHAAGAGFEIASVLPDSAQVLLAIAGGVGAAGAAAVALNKAWQFSLDQLQAFLDNVDRSQKIIQHILDRLDLSRRAESGGVCPIPRDVRILCNATEDNMRVLPIFHALGARVRYRPSNINAGTHRFHVNQYRFVLTFRTPDRRYIGVTGTDACLRERLEAEFLNEWENCGPDVH